ncbi:MAG: hypothetical protein KGV51_03620 [Moraxellaceae bacterium]|nr:hypothetical protein [Moraxellaceae bacterium]
MKKYLPLLLASLLPLSLFSWFIPNPTNQLDFFALWLLAMLLLALPLVYAETALAYRSATFPLAGVAKLTREADASIVWRAFAWINLLIILLIAGSLLNHVSDVLNPLLLQKEIVLPSFAVAVGLMVVAVIVSVWGLELGLAGLLCLLVAMGFNLVNGFSFANVQLTPISLSEWGRAVMLALLSVGAGSGLYWFTQADNKISAINKKQFKATKIVLPIWLTQLVVGTLAFINLQNDYDNSSVQAMIAILGAFCISVFLLKFVSQSLTHYFGENFLAIIKGMLLTLLLACLCAVLPRVWQYNLLIVLTCLSVLMLSVFAGWQMKISHLRKSMNFNSELTYNLWRVAVRLVVPLAVIIAMVGWVKSWFGL